MRVPISWLREYVDLPEDADAIADRLALLGFPVEEITRRPRISGVVVGKIVTLEKHPNADRLQVGSIDVGGAAAADDRDRGHQRRRGANDTGRDHRREAAATHHRAAQNARHRLAGHDDLG